MFVLHCVQYVCGLNGISFRPKGALNERVLSKKSVIQALRIDKSGSDVQEHEVIMDKDVLSSQSGGEKIKGNGERKSSNP